MLGFVESAKRFLWNFVELGFLAILSIVLIYLMLGQSSGSFVLSVVSNVLKFANDVPTPSLIGLAIILALVYVTMQRMRGTAGRDLPQ
jgi:hypothetical protein